MSKAAKATFIGTFLVCAFTVIGVHFVQREERAAMHAGVIRDDERQRIKRERQEDFDIQAALQKELMKSQQVRDTTAEAPPMPSTPPKE